MKYYLELGRLTELSFFELQQLFPATSFESFSDHLVGAELADAELAQGLALTGGVVKAMEEVTVISATDSETVQKTIVEHLQQFDKPTFSINELFLPNQQKSIRLQDIKNKLKEHDVSSRFIESSATGLSASVLLHQDVEELTVIYQDGRTILAKTIWVQDIDDWTNRDRNKPERDPKRGMLPPKLARMMINFTSSDIRAKEGKRLYDPFCGSGTLLMEAMMTGWEAIGSDLSPEAVHDTAQNMHWFAQAYDMPELSALFIADATNVKLAQLGEKVDAIVTEPFLGKQNPTPASLPNVFKGLEKQYWGALKNWTKILNPGGEVVIVTPMVQHKKTTFSLESIIDKSKTLGYNVLSGPLVYRRPQTTVQRAIYVLKYQQ